MNKNPVRDGETRRLEAAARIRQVITTRAVTNGAVAIRLAHGGKRLVVGHIRFGYSLSLWQLSQGLEARVVLLKNGLVGRHPKWFGGEQMDLAVGVPVRTRWQAKECCLYTFW